MPLQEQTSLWSDTTIKMLDEYSGTLQTGSVLRETELTSNVLLLAYGGEGELAMNGEVCHIGASFAGHVVKGTSLTLTARSDDIYYIMIMYKLLPWREPLLFCLHIANTRCALHLCKIR